MEPGWLSLRAYALHRGDSLRAVQKAIDAGRISPEAVRRNDKGHLCAVNVARADAEWARRTDVDQAARNGKTPELPAPLFAQAPADAPQRPAARESDQYLDSRAKREGFLAQQAELDYQERVGTLVSAAAVEAEHFAAFRELRDALENCAPRLSQRLASETDPQRIEHMVRDEIRSVLGNVSTQLSADATAGPDARAAAGA